MALNNAVKEMKYLFLRFLPGYSVYKHVKKNVKNKLKDIDHVLRYDLLSYSLRRGYIDNFFLESVKALSPERLVLDIGGKKKNKRGTFNIENYSIKVLYANITPKDVPDVLTDAHHLPFKNQSFDAVICAEVLEHVREPVVVMKEVYRVLNGEGVFLATVPFLVAFHADPWDYGRYTETFWKTYLAEIGFINIVIEKQGLFWSVLFDICRELLYYHIIYRDRLKSWYMRYSLYRILQWGKKKALQIDSLPNKEMYPFYCRFTTGFSIIASKPKIDNK